METQKTQFRLKEFTQANGFRVFVFEVIEADQTRKSFTVRTDLALTRRYGIHLQDLPLLCRAVLEQCEEGEQKRDFTYTEQDMCRHAANVAAREEAAQKRKPPRRPVTNHVGVGWRVPQG